MNLGQFRTAVDRRTRTATDPSAQTEWVNFVLNEIALEDRWPWLEKSVTVNTVIGQATYTFLAASNVRTVLSVVGPNGQPYDSASVRDLAIADNNQDSIRTQFGWGRFYAMDGDTLYIYPTPSAVEALTVRYVSNEPTLVADGDNPLLPSYYHQAVVELVSELVQSTRLGGADDTRRADRYQARYNRLVRKMQREALRKDGVARLPRIRPGSGL